MTMTARRKRLTIIFGLLVAAAAATALVLNAFKSNLVFFYSPSQVAAHEAPEHRLFRIGGLVLAGSLQREGVDVRFTVTDLAHSMPVRYHGSLPDLFKEGKGVVAQGRLSENGVFVAQEVFAKHDENYMPPEAADALRRAQANGAKGMATPGPTATLARSGPGTPGRPEDAMAMEQKR